MTEADTPLALVVAAAGADPSLAWILITIGILVVAILAAVLIVLAAVLRKLDILDRDFREDVKTIFHAIGRLEGREENPDERKPH